MGVEKVIFSQWSVGELTAMDSLNDEYLFKWASKLNAQGPET